MSEQSYDEMPLKTLRSLWLIPIVLWIFQLDSSLRTDKSGIAMCEIPRKSLFPNSFEPIHLKSSETASVPLSDFLAISVGTNPTNLIQEIL